MHKFLLYNKLLYASTCFEHYVLIIRRSKLYYTASGIITTVSGRPVHRLREDSWNVMAHGDAREGKWRGNWRMQWVAITLHTTSEHGVSSITTADAHTSAASSRLNWRLRRFKWTRPFRWKTKCGFCACAIIFQTQSTAHHHPSHCKCLQLLAPTHFCYTVSREEHFRLPARSP